jgi:glyoxylase-like metal-dependent hydrolase (beta-lactamase superfamily II)
MKQILFAAALTSTLCTMGLTQSTQTPEGPKQYVPILPTVRKQFWEIDPTVGYAEKGVGGAVYVISDNMWQSAFLVTNDSVIVFDAPESFAAKIPSAIASVTSQPIKYLVYSHIHRDHIRGAVTLGNIKGLKIVALQGVSDFLKTQMDPNRPIPDEAFGRNRRLTAI